LLPALSLSSEHHHWLNTITWLHTIVIAFDWLVLWCLIPLSTIFLFKKKCQVWQLYVFIKISKARRVRRDHDREMFNTTFNNISIISWRSVLLMGENGLSRENNWLPIMFCSFSYLDVWNVRQTTSGVYDISVTTSTYHSRRYGRL
jgi:hypothetical protein